MLIRFADGTQYEAEINERKGILRNRERPIIEGTFTGPLDVLDEIREKACDPGQTESVTIIYHGDNPDLTPEQLEGVADKACAGYTIPGEITLKEVAVVEETPEAPAQYGWQLNVQLGQRLFGE